MNALELAHEVPNAKLLRKKLKNGLIIDKWDLVTIIEKQETMLRQLHAELEAHKQAEIVHLCRIRELEDELKLIDELIGGKK